MERYRKRSFLPSLLFCLVLLCPVIIWAQVPVTQVRHNITVGGKVADANGNGLPGVIILYKEDSSIKATSNSEGQFVIALPELKGTLTFSLLGFQKKEIQIDRNTKLPIVVALEEGKTDLNEVVVTGYVERPKDSFTGNATTFTGEDLQRIGNRNLLLSLQHLDPSFVLQENLAIGSNPNQLPDVQLRGANSLQDLQGDYTGNPNQPLFILDGFEATLQKVFDLDMNRVASVTILKDASAKAIYGARAANGVVVIETVIPQEGQMRITYTGNFNVDAPDLTSYNLTNAAEKLQVELNAGRYTSTQPYTQQFLREQYNATLADVMSGVDTYWLSQPLQVGVGQKHSLYAEGGGSSMRYGIDIGYNKVTGVMKESGRENVNGTINFSYRYGKILLRNILSINYNRADNSPYGSFAEYTQLNPYWSPYDEYGNMKKVLGSFQSSSSSSSTPTYYYNPLYNATLGTKDFSRYAEVTENFYAEFQATQSLRLTARVGFTHNNNSSEVFYPGDHTSFAEWTGDRFYQRGSYTMRDGFSRLLSTDVFANWSRNFGKHFVLANVGWNTSSNTSDTHGMTAWGFLNNRVDYISFARQYQENGSPYGNEAIQREVGFIAFANYAYDNRYLADVSLRRHASSIFGADNRWGNFWSVGLGWNLHNERFFADDDVVDQFRLRGSIGATGSQNFNPYQAMATYTFFTSSTYDNISGAYLMSLANDRLQWQQTRDINIGTDINLFKRLNLKVDWYLSTTDNLLIDFTLPPSTGFSSYKENLGELENRGIEAMANWQFYANASKHAFASLTATVAHNTNKLKKISDALRNFNEEQDTQTDDLTNPLTRYEEGQSMNAIWAVPSLGIDPITGSEIFVSRNGGTTYNWNAQDQVVAGDTNPKYRGNFGLNLEYEGFGLNCMFSYLWGADYYNSTLVQRVENANIAYNVDSRVFSGTWQNPGDEVYFKRITSTPTTTRPTTRFVERKNDLTLSSLNVYYDFKWKNLSRYHLQNLRLTFYTNDVFVASTVRTERGTSYPFARAYSFSIRATF